MLPHLFRSCTGSGLLDRADRRPRHQNQLPRWYFASTATKESFPGCTERWDSESPKGFNLFSISARAWCSCSFVRRCSNRPFLQTQFTFGPVDGGFNLDGGAGVYRNIKKLTVLHKFSLLFFLNVRSILTAIFASSMVLRQNTRL